MAGPNLYWIDRNGNHLDAGWDHMNAVLEEPKRFYTESQVEEIENDPTFDMIRKRENPYLWKNDVVRVRSFGTDVYIQGTDRAIRKYLDELIVDNKNADYSVSVMNPESGEIKNQFAGMSLSKFMKKFSGRSRGGYSSKVSRFREVVRKEVKNILFEADNEFNDAARSSNSVVSPSNPQNAFWMLSDGTVLGSGDNEHVSSHRDFSLKGAPGLYKTTRSAFYSHGAIRIWADSRFPSSNYAIEIPKRPTTEQKRSLGKLISNLLNSKKVEVEAKKEGESNFFRTKEARLFDFVLDDIEDFYSRGSETSKISKFR